MGRKMRNAVTSSMNSKIPFKAAMNLKSLLKDIEHNY